MAIDGFKVHGALVLAVLASGVGAAVAGGGSGGVVLAGPQVIRLLQQAPAALDSFPALSLTMTVHVSVNGRSESQTATGYTTPDGRTGLLTMQAPGTGLGFTLKVLDGRMYAKRLSSPGWLACTPTSATPSPSVIGTDGVAYLRLMPGASGPVRVVGHTTIDGAKTTRYRVNIDIAQAVQAAAARGGAPVDEEKIQELRQAGITTLPVDAWIDAQNEVRQFAFAFHFQGVSMSMTIRLRGTNTVPTVAAPSPVDVSYASSCQFMLQQLTH